jgi:hypothetical protein
LDRQRGWEDPQPDENEHVPIPAMLDVTVAAAVFPAGGLRLARRLDGAGDPFERRPGVVTCSWLTVKEQMAGRYATELARSGYTAALTFDFAGWGDRGGELRHVESPASKIADIAAAYPSSRSFVAPGGVAYVGICASAQYALATVAAGAPIRSFAAVAGWFHDTSTVAPFYGGRTGVEERLPRGGRGDRAIGGVRRSRHCRGVRAGPRPGRNVPRARLLRRPRTRRRAVVVAEHHGRAELAGVTDLRRSRRRGPGEHPGPVRPLRCVCVPRHGSGARRVGGPVEVAWGDGTQTDFYDQPEQLRFGIEAVDRHLIATMPVDEEVRV